MIKALARVARASFMQASAPHPGASSARRLRGWTASNEAINSLLFTDGDRLRERSHDVLRKSPWASSALDKWVSNAVGTGIKPQWRHPDPAINRKLQEDWTRWTDESDADSLTDFYGQQALAYRSMIEGGENFARKRFRRLTDGMHIPLQIQLMEAEFLPYQQITKLVPTQANNKIICGIEFNAIGKRVAYHLYRSHPGETVGRVGALETSPVPADQVMHLFRPLRIGQFRGEPWLAKVLVALHDLERMEDATLQAQLMAQLFAGYIMNPTGSAVVEPDTSNGDTVGRSVAEVGLEAGTIWQLDGGQEIKFTDPPQISDYVPYTKDRRMAIAAGLSSTYSQTTGDYSVANFSSIRAETLEFRRLCEQIQNQTFVFQFCRPVIKAWVEQAVLASRISAADYAARPWAYLGVEWRTPRWAWVDPLKDVKAELMMIEGGLKARATTINEMGEDEDVVDEARARDKAREKRLNLDPIVPQGKAPDPVPVEVTNG